MSPSEGWIPHYEGTMPPSKCRLTPLEGTLPPSADSTLTSGGMMSPSENDAAFWRRRAALRMYNAALRKHHVVPGAVWICENATREPCRPNQASYAVCVTVSSRKRWICEVISESADHLVTARSHIKSSASVEITAVVSMTHETHQGIRGLPEESRGSPKSLVNPRINDTF